VGSGRQGREMQPVGPKRHRELTPRLGPSDKCLVMFARGLAANNRARNSVVKLAGVSLSRRRRVDGDSLVGTGRKYLHTTSLTVVVYGDVRSLAGAGGGWAVILVFLCRVRVW
jgi:hypothetical protein